MCPVLRNALLAFALVATPVQAAGLEKVDLELVIAKTLRTP